MAFEWGNIDKLAAEAGEGRIVTPADAAQMKAAERTFGPDPIHPAVEGMGFWDLFGSGMGKSASDSILGVRMLASKLGKSEDETNALIREYIQKKKMDAPLMSTGAGKAGAVVGDIATSFLPTTRAWSTPARAAATGAALGAIHPNEDPSTYSNALQAVTGGVIGGGVTYVGNKIANSIAGQYGRHADAMELDKAARELYGIDLRPSDLPDGHPLWNMVDKLAPRVPFVGQMYGTSIKEQADQIGKVLNKEIKGPTGRTEIQNFFQDRIKTHARGLLDRNAKNWENVYALAEGSVQGVPRARNLNLRDFSAAVDEYLKKYTSAALADIEDKTLVAKLKRIGAMHGSGQNVMTNFRNSKELMSAIGALQRAKGSEFTKTGRPSQDQVNMINKMYGALKGDIDRWGTNPHNAAAYDAYKSAVDFTKHEVVPFFDVNDSRVIPMIVDKKFDYRPEEMYMKLLDPNAKTELNRISQRLPYEDSVLLDIMRNANPAMKELAGRDSFSGPLNGLAVPLLVPHALADPAGMAGAAATLGGVERGLGMLEKSRPLKRLLMAAPTMAPETYSGLSALLPPAAAMGKGAATQGGLDVFDRSLIE